MRRGTPGKGPEGGFTLIEAMVAMAVFAIGALMLVPTVATWMESNTGRMQQAEAARLLNAYEADISLRQWGDPVWGTTVGATANNESQARNLLQGAVLQDINGVGGNYSSPRQINDLGMTASINYGVVQVNQGGSPVNRLMRLRVQWQGPNGDTLTQQRWLRH
ncbi:type II secretion system protein [Thiohalorhabdus sp.]|uniref:type II secretion system protein n=1 Tax=Thiohalorhabdus sp. TaxID=3094134 RepID=UPI002FC2DFC2